MAENRYRDGRRAAQFLPGPRAEETRWLDLLLELRRNGFDIARTRAELEAIPHGAAPKSVLSNAELRSRTKSKSGTSSQVSDMVRQAIELLQYNAGGYLLVGRCGTHAQGCAGKQRERTLGETVELDRQLQSPGVTPGKDRQSLFAVMSQSAD